MSSNELKQIDKIIVYTDGSCMRKKDHIFCGYGVYYPNGEIKNISKPFTQSKPVTHQGAELYAIYKAIKKVVKAYAFNKLMVYTDSQYSIDCVTKWIVEWKKNNWKTSKNKDVLHSKIIKNIDKYLSDYSGKIEIKYVPTKSEGNIDADELAKSGALQLKQMIKATK